MQEITQEYIKFLFNYENGKLYWKNKTSIKSNIKINDEAGSLNKNRGYYRIGINYKLYFNHRLIFLYFNGYLPKFIDHIDGNKENNKIENLRPATSLQNCMNRKGNKNSSSKYKGVSWHKPLNKWCTHIQINGKQTHIGYFKLESNAAKAYNDAVLKYHDNFAKLNKIEVIK